MAEESFGCKGKTVEERKAAFAEYRRMMDERKKGSRLQCISLKTEEDVIRAKANLALSRAMVRKQLLAKGGK